MLSNDLMPSAFTDLKLAQFYFSYIGSISVAI